MLFDNHKDPAQMMDVHAKPEYAETMKELKNCIGSSARIARFRKVFPAPRASLRHPRWDCGTGKN